MRVLSTSVRGLEMPVGECLCIARGACPFLCPWSAWCFVYYCTSAHVQQKCTVVQYEKKGRTPTNERTNERTNEPRTKFHLTSSGARALRGWGAMCLLRRRRCMFFAPQCAALRCPWLSALLMPVVRVPSCARGPPCVFVYCTCTTNLYYCTVL